MLLRTLNIVRSSRYGRRKGGKVTGIGMLGNGVLWIVLLGMLNASVAVAKSGVYGPIMTQRVWTRAEKRPVEEALLNFKIEAAVDAIVPKVCGADMELDRDRRLLDPQLPTSDTQNNLDAPTFIVCTEAEPVLPMDR